MKRGIWHPLGGKKFEKLQQEAENCPRRKKSPTEKYSRADGNINRYIMICVFILIAGISRLRKLAFFDKSIIAIRSSMTDTSDVPPFLLMAIKK